MVRRARWWLTILAVMAFGAITLAACEDPDAAPPGTARQEVRRDLEDLRAELAQGVTPERKEQILRRCVRAVARLAAENDADAERLTHFCESVEATTTEVPAAWSEVRARLDELIEKLES